MFVARDHGCSGCVAMQRHSSWTWTRHLPVVRWQMEKNSSHLQQRQEENTTLLAKIIIQEDFYFLSLFQTFMVPQEALVWQKADLDTWSWCSLGGLMSPAAMVLHGERLRLQPLRHLSLPPIPSNKYVRSTHGDGGWAWVALCAAG